MKKTLKLAMLFLFVVVSVSGVFAQTESGGGGGSIPSVQSPVNSLKVSHVLRDRPIVSYCGERRFNGLRDGKIEPVIWFFRLNLQRQVTEFRVNDVPYLNPGDPPWDGLPVYTGQKINQCWTWVNGLAADGRSVVYGNEYRETCSPWESITIWLQLDMVLKFLSPDLRGNNPSDLCLVRLRDGQVVDIVDYNDYYGGFWIWMDSILLDEYRLVNWRTGAVIWTRWLNYDSDPNSGDVQVGLNLPLPAGVQEARFEEGQDYLFLPRQLFRGMAPVSQLDDAYLVPAAVYNVDTGGQWFEVYTNGAKGCLIEIYESDENGQDICVAQTVRAVGDENGDSASIVMPPGHGEFGVVIRTVEGSAPADGFNVSFRRWSPKG